MKRLFLLIMSVMMIYGCSDSGTDDNPNPKSNSVVTKIYLSTYNLDFETKGGKKSVTVKFAYDIPPQESETQWQLVGDESWCTPSQTSGKDGDEVTFTVMENNDSEERNVTFTFLCGAIREKLVVTQKQRNTLTITPAKIEIEAAGGDAIIEIKANVDFDYTIDKDCIDWITAKEPRSMQTTTLIFNITPNTTLQKRIGKITIYNNEFSETVTITQAGESPLNIIVHVPQKEMLETTLVNYDYTKIESLTITGELGELDFYLIRNQLPQLRNLNISATNVNEIPSQAFINSKIEKCILPKGLTTIGEKAFYNSLLTSILIPANVETIDQSAFQDCSRLVELKFEQGSKLTTIKGGYTSYNINCYGVFANCAALTSVEIPANVETIEAAAFKGCTNLTSVAFGRNSNLKIIKGGYDTHYEHINYGAFTDCTALKSIEIPASVETIEVSAFQGCSQLQAVSFESSSKLKEIGGASMQYPHGAFTDCIALSAIEIPASVTTIGAAAFYGCSSLRQITFKKPSALSSINGGLGINHGYGTFAKCTSLTTIEIPASIERLYNPIFSRCSNLTTISFEKGSKLKYISSAIFGVYSGAFAQLDKLTTFDASACTQLESIDKQTFNRNPNLTSIIIGAVIPPTCTEQAFVEMNPNCVLKVPSESLSAYKTADGWKTFQTIKPLNE